jgi:hypothetical protein
MQATINQYSPVLLTDLLNDFRLPVKVNLYPYFGSTFRNTDQYWAVFYYLCICIQMLPRSGSKTLFNIDSYSKCWHSLLFSLFAIRSSATSTLFFAIATPLLFQKLQYTSRYSLSLLLFHQCCGLHQF